MTPVEQQIDDVFREVLRRPASGLEATLYTKLIETKQIDWPTMRRALQATPECRNWQNHPDNRDAVTERIVQASGSAVLGGPFTGMRLLGESSRGDGDLAPKLLGTYEQELHPFIEGLRDRPYDAIVDVGSAEGYYAIGFARLFPDTSILAFDTDPAARAVLARNAAANAYSERIAIGERCDTATLGEIYASHARVLVFADCEGFEKALFGNAAVNRSGARADLIVECHNAWDATITPTLMAALEPSHRITKVDQAGRNPNAFPFLADLAEWDRWRAVWERRGAAQHWLICLGRDR